MELKNFFAQDAGGSIIPGATCDVFFPNTTERVTTLQNAAGTALSNPFFANARGLIQFAAPNGLYDLRVTGNGASYTIRVQCADLTDFVYDAAASAAAAAASAASADATVLRNDLADGETVDNGADLVAYDASTTVRDRLTQSLQFDTDLQDDTDPAKGAALVGYRGRTVFDRLSDAVCPEDFGAVGNGLADDTAAVVAAFQAGNCYFKSEYACEPFEVEDMAIRAIFLPGSKLIFNHQGSNSATFSRCSGVIDGMTIDDTKETIEGVYITLFLNECDMMQVNRPKINGGKDLPVAMYQCDDCVVSNGTGVGTDLNRPFAWEIINCSNSSFVKCKLFKYQFGFVLLGPGYKTGFLPVTRTWQEALGMSIKSCYVEDYTGHAFDVNGTAGALIADSTAFKYTGTLGNSAFQVKQSTNIAEELPDATFANTVSNCFAIDCVTGFGAQESTDVIFSNIHVVNAARYAVALNSSKRAIVDGLTVKDWGLDIANFPLLNGDSVCAAVAIWSGSEYCNVRDVSLAITNNTNPNFSSMSLCNVVGNNAIIGAFTYRREAAVTGILNSALRISGSNCLIEEGFRPNSAGLYANDPIDDLTTNCMYPLTFSVIVDMSTVANYPVPSMPQRGLIVGKVSATVVETVPAGGTYSFGVTTDTDLVVLARATPAGIEFVDPESQNIGPNAALSARVVTASSGKLLISARAVHGL